MIELLVIYPREIKTYVYIKPFTNVHKSFIRNSKKLETTQMSFNGWIETFYGTFMRRVLLNNKKEMNYRYVEQLDKSPKNYAKWKKLILKGLHTVWSCLYSILEMAKL